MRFFVRALLACLCCAPALAGLADDMHRGVNMALWYHDLEGGMDALGQSLDQFKALGGNIVLVNEFWRQDNNNSLVIYPDDAFSATDATVLATIDAIQSRGLRVGLKPVVLVADGINSQIPGGTAWFNGDNGYREYIKHYAGIAAAKNVDLFVVGAELFGTSSQTSNWTNVISDVRAQNYTGELTYSALWGYPAVSENVTWWNQLDYIGISAYYPLTTSFSPSLDQLKAAWANRAQAIDGWWTSLPADCKKPILFTEAGYTSLDGANTDPPNTNVSSTIDQQEQADCYEALLSQLWEKEPWFKGVNWWCWQPYLSGVPNPYFMPQGKPAEQVMGRYYAPEPSSLALGLSGLAGLLLVWRPRRRWKEILRSWASACP